MPRHKYLACLDLAWDTAITADECSTISNNSLPLLVSAIVGMAGGVVSDQAEADEEMSVKQRLMLAGGSVLAEGGGAVGDLTGVQLAADALEVAGEWGNWKPCVLGNLRRIL